MRHNRGALTLLRFPNPSGNSKPATTRSGRSGTESNGRGRQTHLRSFCGGSGNWAHHLATTISEFFDSICWADLLALGVCFGIAPDTKRSGRAAAKSHHKQPTLKGYNWTMSAVQCDNVRKVKCRPLRNRGCKLEHPLTVFIGEGIEL